MSQIIIKSKGLNEIVDIFIVYLRQINVTTRVFWTIGITEIHNNKALRL